MLFLNRAPGKLMAFLFHIIGTACPGGEFGAHTHPALVLCPSCILEKVDINQK
jgi:hypothetical protein